jgi:hypothetical protein
MSDLATSLAGLAGVAVGGGATYLTQLRLDGAREKRARQREQNEAMAAARLIGDDLYRAQTAITDYCMSNQAWWPGNPMRREPSSEEVGLIAGKLTWEEWRAVDHGVAAFRELTTRRDQSESGRSRRTAQISPSPSSR